MKFKNEFGRKIELTVKSRKQKDVTLIKFTLSGPTSSGDWEITKKEAQKLVESLEELL